MTLSDFGDFSQVIMGWGQQTLVLAVLTGFVTAALTATYTGLAAWKGAVIALVAIVAGLVALPYMGLVWREVAVQGGMGGMSAGSADQTTWIGAACVAGVAAAGMAGWLRANISETLWIVCISSLATWSTYHALLIVV